MKESELRRLLAQVQSGGVSLEDAIESLRPTAELGFASLDVHRESRSGQPEAVFAEGKESGELLEIVERLIEHRGRVLVTRVAADVAAALEQRHPRGIYHRRARVWQCGRQAQERASGPLAVVSAGTSDLNVAEEAAVVAEWHGLEVQRHWDVGVAGVHRLLERLGQIRAARAAIVVAGMEGALPTLVAGLVRCPVIAVPTSVGYGASFSGLAALLAMLNTCAGGVSVVNIDNGYGAAVVAHRILAAAGPPSGRSTSIASP